ncbi:phospholipid carrier-dependent glycosyltransferase [Thermomonospora amylolytica]|uniref:phospholipid carrier-dependent glycosyltransferase n=1 Tax=Thermomonospora amylolytica TaxID=1411117 RepID=UPI000E6B5BC9|nr:phospholipid carrier-dependent glycosyltransferase [Thermomonospora amylolytica]
MSRSAATGVDGDPSWRALPARVRALIGRHPAFSVIIAIAVLVRLAAMLAYRPAVFFNDSFDYLHAALDPYPHPLRPSGYSFLLLALEPLHSFAVVAAVQHLMGLATGVMIYALLRRRFGLPGWGAALAAAPVLLDAYQIQLEHLVLSDAPFIFWVTAAVTLLLWNERPGPKAAAGVGLLVAAAWLTRSVGLPVLLGICVFMVLRRVGWRTIAVTLAACALPVAAYMGWYSQVHGKFAMTESNGVFLFARAYKFADCRKIPDLTVDEQQLCVLPDNKLPNSQDGIWDRRSPLKRVVDMRFGPRQNEIAGGFSRKAIVAQPGDYATVVAGDFFRTFRWEREVFPDLKTYRLYEFEKSPQPLPTWSMDADSTAADVADEYERGSAQPRVVEPFGHLVRVYQDHVYLRGTMVGVLLLVGLAGMAPLWRRFGGAAFLPWTLATGLLLAPAATAEFDYRYVLPAVPLASLAAGMAFAGPLGAASSRRRARREAAAGVDAGAREGTPERPAVASSS